MPFGWVTRPELEVRSEELRAEYQRGLEDQRALVKRIQLEWEEWFDKFRRLYARLNKRMRDGEVAEGGKGGDGPGPREDAPAPSPASIDPAKLAAWRARRGF
jgi:hypothetical protein